MDSPEEITSPLLNADSPDIVPDQERPITPDLDLTDNRDDEIVNSSSYKPPSPITLPTFDDNPGASGENVDDMFGNISDTEEQKQGQQKRSGLITDIFGDSDDEEEHEEPKKEKEELPQEEVKPEEAKTEEAEKKKDDDDIDTDEELEMLQKNDNVFVSDFDLMMERKKTERSKQMSRRKKEVTDFITSADDRIIYLISQMKEAASEDRRLNQAGQPAINKLSLLSSIRSQINKHDLQTAFIECGLLQVIAEWLTPLPDNSLPHITIRTELLTVLKTYNSINADMLKDSKLGRVVMALYKNTKETFHNRETARKLIHCWARPIFGLDSKYNAMSREERIDADLRHMVKSRKRKRKSTDDSSRETGKPGDKNFIIRARVPLPSNTDYVIRPRSKIDETVVQRRPKQNPKLEKLNKSVANRKRLSNPSHLRSSHVCVTGNKMPL